MYDTHKHIWNIVPGYDSLNRIWDASAVTENHVNGSEWMNIDCTQRDQSKNVICCFLTKTIFSSRDGHVCVMSSVAAFVVTKSFLFFDSFSSCFLMDSLFSNTFECACAFVQITVSCVCVCVSVICLLHSKMLWQYAFLR